MNEENETYAKIVQLKMTAGDGKKIVIEISRIKKTKSGLNMGKLTCTQWL